jgi:hypothetical protein
VAGEADQNMVSWIEWSYWNRDPCCVRPTEGLIRDISKPPSGDNVKSDKLAALARPYPQAVAGTPHSLSFDPATREFDLAYSTAGPRGGPLPSAARTEVVVPSVQYPGGYVASVTHGSVVSRRGASVLRIANDPGARDVTVKLTPTGGAGSAQPNSPTKNRKKKRRRGRGCGARTRVVIPIPGRVGRVVRARVFVDGHRSKTIRARRLRRVVLGVPHPGRRAPFTVALRLRTASGRRFSLTRRFGPCGTTPTGSPAGRPGGAKVRALP